jgi:N-acetylmuramoyl-L-alanine amidase
VTTPPLRPTRPILTLAILCLATPLLAQQSPQFSPNRNLILLDPAHGGSDNGAHISDVTTEKDVNLAIAAKLRTTLTAQNFSVLATRDSDTAIPSEQRADIANHAHPLACILIHATSAGFGPYLAASSLTPDPIPHLALPWDTAQAAFVGDSLTLLDSIAASLHAASLNPVTLRASVPPIDNLTCPAILLELAPFSGSPVTDDTYQQRVADALTTALVAWRTRSEAEAPKPAPKPPKLAPAPPGAPQ